MSKVRPVRNAVIAQARMTSERLPRKVLQDLGGKPVMAHLIERARRIEGIDVVCIATSDQPSDDPVAEFAQSMDVHVYRGSLSDVLDRYYQAALEIQADTIMRVTCDCPFIDPEVCAGVLQLYHRQETELVTNVNPPIWPHGLDCEVFGMEKLAEAQSEATEPYDREHVTPFIKKRYQSRIVNFDGPGGDNTGLRWTVDYPEDLEHARAVYAVWQEKQDTGEPGWRELAEIVRSHPELRSINEKHMLPMRREIWERDMGA